MAYRAIEDVRSTFLVETNLIWLRIVGCEVLGFSCCCYIEREGEDVIGR